MATNLDIQPIQGSSSKLPTIGLNKLIKNDDYKKITKIKTKTIESTTKIITSNLDIEPTEENTSILSTTGLIDMIKDEDYNEVSKIETKPMESTTFMPNLETNAKIPQTFTIKSSENISLNTETSAIPESTVSILMTTGSKTNNSSSSVKRVNSSNPITMSSIINKTETNLSNKGFSNEPKDKEIYQTTKPRKTESVFDWLSLINDDSEKTIYESFYELLDYKNKNKLKSN